jgi:hypothetical protein
VSVRILLARLVDAGSGLDPAGDGDLDLCPPVDGAAVSGDLVQMAKVARVGLRRLVTDRALATAWPGLPMVGLTPTIRTLLACYALERADLSPVDQARMENQIAGRVRDGWPAGCAKIISLEEQLAAREPELRVSA